MGRVTDDERRVVEGRLRELAERKVPCDIDCYIAEAVMGHDFCETPCDGCLSRVLTLLADLIEQSCDRDTSQKVAEEMFGKMRHSTKEEADAYDAMLKSKSVEIHPVDRDALLALADDVDGAADDSGGFEPLADMLRDIARSIREALGVVE